MGIGKGMALKGMVLTYRISDTNTRRWCMQVSPEDASRQGPFTLTSPHTYIDNGICNCSNDTRIWCMQLSPGGASRRAPSPKPGRSITLQGCYKGVTTALEDVTRVMKIHERVKREARESH
jgi:hypothetical protein